jgi:hypothetical protein
LRPFVEALDLGEADGAMRMTLRHDPERGIGRPEEVLAALGDLLRDPVQPASLVRERLVLAPPAPVAAAPRPRAGRQAVATASRPRK